MLPGCAGRPRPARPRRILPRLGHASPVAANRYLHTVDGRDAEIAAALSELAEHGDAARLPKTINVKAGLRLRSPDPALRPNRAGVPQVPPQSW